MFKKILIANRGENAAGVSAKPDCAAGAARQGD
jgi:acetyl/propionyl-CoA carboxylase alpha subunit